MFENKIESAAEKASAVSSTSNIKIAHSFEFFSLDKFYYGIKRNEWVGSFSDTSSVPCQLQLGHFCVLVTHGYLNSLISRCNSLSLREAL